MIQVVWEYTVKPEQVPNFEGIYASSGSWARLFQKSRAYHGTILLRDPETPHRYLTVDVWASRADYDAFRSEHAGEYEELDRKCDELTVSERCLGVFEMV
jgi:heme-degrading monooxygenase HmoA